MSAEKTLERLLKGLVRTVAPDGTVWWVTPEVAEKRRLETVAKAISEDFKESK